MFEGGGFALAWQEVHDCFLSRVSYSQLPARFKISLIPSFLLLSKAEAENISPLVVLLAYTQIQSLTMAGARLSNEETNHL